MKCGQDYIIRRAAQAGVAVATCEQAHVAQAQLAQRDVQLANTPFNVVRLPCTGPTSATACDLKSTRRIGDMPDPGMFEFSKHRDIQREERELSFRQEAGYCRDLADAFEGQPEEGLLIHLAQAFERLGESTVGKVRDPF